ncbi:Oligosaccharide translocation protein rft1 [Naganishia albida]|nr:Oligosaccharide translocation protein rft1 [Naganishia albida]
MSAQSEPHKGSPLQRADHRNNAPAETNLASSLTSAKALIALQLLSRLITFSLNQALIRIASPKVFGTAAVQFDLVRDTILFLSREGVRAVVIRIPGERKVQGNQAAEWIQDTRIHNLVHLPAVFGIIVAGGLLPIYLQSLPTTTTSQSYFHSSLALYVVATLVELVTEPFYLASQLSTPVNTGIRVQAEGTAIIVRAIVTVVCLAAASDRYALLAFAVGQLAYSVTLGGRYVRAYWNHGSLWRMPFRQSTQTALLPSTKTSSSLVWPYIYPHHLKLLIALLGQSIIKHFLTEADRIVVAWASPLEDQGGYAVASNYASLVARIVFQPVEESARLYFAREIEVDPGHAAARSSVNASPFLFIFSMVRVALYLLLLCLSFVPPLAGIVFPYLLPRSYRHTSAFQTLTAYVTLYLPILGMNGILEAFFAATSGVKGLGRQSGVMVVSSGAFAGTLMLLSRFRHRLGTSNDVIPTSLVNPAWLHTWTNPEVSLVYANVVSMLVRIVFAFRHAASLTDTQLDVQVRRRIRKVPALRNVAVVVVSAVLVRWLVRYAERRGLVQSLLGQAGVVGGSGVLALVCLGAIFLDEKPRWKAAVSGGVQARKKAQ